MMLDVPSVTINESIPSSTTSAPLIEPDERPTASAARIERPIDQPWLTFRIASDHRRQMPIVAATERS